ncbi:MAG: imidazolonepropionase [Peptostreptococcaceae bacterium]|nr:imidazolonepropionase [Peptostreptococcaceae bacterium]
MKADLLIHNIAQLFSPKDLGRPLRGSEMAEAEILENAYIAVKDGKILSIGVSSPDPSLIGEETKKYDAKNRLVTPGLVDSHTHLVHGGSRENEFSMKLNGVSYLDILAAGGGILSTVRATRAASEEELYDKAKNSLDTMLIHGTTTVEAKSGYGLDIENELKQLRVAKKLDAGHPVDLVSTFMGAHAVPTEYKETPEIFVDLLVEEMIPKVAEEKLAEFCDVFCEHGVFSVDQTKRILESAKKQGLKVKIHADEIVSLGGAELSAKVGAHSAEHLMAASDEGIRQMAGAQVIANLLPGTTFSLMKDTYANARKMIESGLAVALSTDYNPGSCPTENIQLIMQLGCLAMKMTPIEVLNAVTVNAAHSLGRGESIGSFTPGKKADIVIFDAPNIDYIFYHFGINHAAAVFKNGKLAAENRRVL